MKNMIDYQIIDAVDASIYWKDLSGKYIGCNKYMSKMAGMSRNQIIGNTDYLLPWKNQANKIREVDLWVINNLKEYKIEETAIVYGGIKKIFLSSKSPLLNENGDVIGIIGVSIDITHYKRFEEEFKQTEIYLNKYSSIKNRFLDKFSQESRIPLSNILSLSQLSRDKWDQLDDVAKRQNMELIFNKTSQLSQFILNVFDASIFFKDMIQLELKFANFSNFVKDTVKQYQENYCDVKVNIEMNHFDDYCFAFDQKLITRVINNLMMNAIQYSNKNKAITISLYKTYLKDTEIPAVQFCIRDEGVGIPENELGSIFDPFVESSITSSKDWGVGLGLAICKEIIEAHLGNIWVENNILRSGTTFNFTLPVSLSSNNFNNIDKNTEDKGEYNNIIRKNLEEYTNPIKKEPFALIGISPFNSYFSTEKILKICEWINSRYNDFAIFIPDEISRYTFEALGYTESRIGRKIKKQDNYTLNKTYTALSYFYNNHPQKKDQIRVHTISQLKHEKSFQDIYHIYSHKFVSDKQFRQNCLEVTEWVLLNNNAKDHKIEEFHKNIAAQYFLTELPILTNATNILKVESCDFVYHSIPKFLKQLYLSKEIVSSKQKFLILQ